jgi:beta-ureidopropionase / N-carbamoyl-L-amino-acid hydrolase
MSTFGALWDSLLPIGRDPATGGYRRFCWTPAELECRAWFQTSATQRQLRVAADGNGNLFAWWDVPTGAPAVATGSHLDSVPDGGAFDGPLGVVSAFAAIDELRASGFRSWWPRSPRRKAAGSAWPAWAAGC